VTGEQLLVGVGIVLCVIMVILTGILICGSLGQDLGWWTVP